MDKSIISTKILIDALNYYQSKGFQPIDVPMVVDSASARLITAPDKPFLYHNDYQVYIGSAEQGFIQLYKDNELPQGKFMAVTPCYRYETHYDAQTYYMFMELKLIHIGDNLTSQDRNNMINICQSFFKCYHQNITIDYETLSSSIDIFIEYDDNMYSGTKIGSYGMRYMPDGMPYIYGTGVAFPRIGTKKSSFR